MKTKPIYKLRISLKERIFIIYKLSNYTTYPITITHMGLAYDKKNKDYSDKLLKYCKKYNIDINDSYLTDSFSDFCSKIYINEEFKKIKNLKTNTPKRIIEYCYDFYKSKRKK